MRTHGIRTGWTVVLACVCALAFAAMLLATTSADAATSYTLGESTAPPSESTQATTSMTNRAKSSSYKVIYHLNGGIQADDQVLYVKKHHVLKTGKLKKPKRAYYKFAGWYANEKLTKKAPLVRGVSKRSQRTVYAKWKRASYKLTYQLNGGKLPAGYAKTIKKGKTVKASALAKPTRAGYTFAGWYVDKKLTKKATAVQGVSKAAKRTVYAKWTSKTYKVSYIADDGSYTMRYMGSYKTSKGLSSLMTPTRMGYSFIAWYADPALTQLESSIPAGAYGDRTFYAKWRKRIVVAHRGYHAAGATENSLEAFAHAADRGFRYVETDVRFTADNQAVLCHDATIPVYAKGPDGQATGPAFNLSIATATLDQLQNGYVAVTPSGTYQEVPVLVERRPDEEGPGEGRPDDEGNSPNPIQATPDNDSAKEDAAESAHSASPDELSDSPYASPSIQPIEYVTEMRTVRKNVTEFDEFLDECKSLDLVPYIELKKGTAKQIRGLVAEIDKRGMTHQVRWMSFYPKLLKRVKSIHAQSDFTYLTRSATKAKIATVQSLASDGGEVSLSLEASKHTKKAVKICRAAGVPLGAWILASDYEAYRYNRFVNCFIIDGITSVRAQDIM